MLKINQLAAGRKADRPFVSQIESSVGLEDLHVRRYVLQCSKFHKITFYIIYSFNYGYTQKVFTSPRLQRTTEMLRILENSFECLTTFMYDLELLGPAMLDK